jgi:cellulose synthase/poly-beta-1,6-N-acetylglucosamine synthase-like glycosyltransferase/spore germination protein YaaH/peptidoglycan/xylan/chitin deacetylase (PgdA/CDA1 family)
METRQVFLTTSPTRWQRFKWTFRLLLFLGAILIAVLVLAYRKGGNPSLPQLREKNEKYKAILHPGKHLLMQENRVSDSFEGFRKYISARPKKVKTVKADSIHEMDAAIRAAFYVAWDAQSYFSLRANISKLNMILPEWFFIDPNGDTLTTNIDHRGDSVIKASGVEVIPMLSNNFHEKWQGDAVHRIITDPAKKQRLINDVVNTLLKNHYKGINIDFEELKENSDEDFTAFIRDLSERLHKEGLLVTQDISPFNSDYNLGELAKYNDYIFLMSYDQHDQSSVAGPICAQKWIEATVDDAVKSVPADKLVLCLAGFGYDWPKDDEGKDVTYEEALSTAGEEDARVNFDNNTYNVHYTYYDDDSIPHDVYFTDAATNFNTLRFAAEYGLAGTSLWRLGSEDSRLWKFYNKDMSSDGLDTFNFAQLSHVRASNDVDYIGEGEILDVMSTPKDGIIKTEIDSSEMLISEEHYLSLPSVFVVKKYGNAPGKIVLTFDDGPDPKFTPQILDILNREHVPATFFLIGINAENNIPLVKRLYNEGYEIGNHSFTHPNMAEVSMNRAVVEMRATRKLIECITGHSTIMFRAPYNADSEPESMQELIPVALSKKYNYLTVGESIDPNDWEEGVTADTIVARVIRQQDMGSIILLHDAGGNTRKATVEALPRIIHYFKSKGYQFTTVADLVGKSRNELMPAVPNAGFELKLNYVVVQILYWGGNILFSLFVVCIILSVARILFMGVLAALEHRSEKKKNLPPLPGSPLVSIIVPAYNEEVNAVSSLNNLLKLQYPNFNIIFVDDGSKDGTYAKVAAAFKDNDRVAVLTKPNGGKASALNYGISHTDADYVLCIDADTKLLPGAIAMLMRHFAEEHVAAVAGNVKVGNEVNFITRWQSIEYITSQNFDRKAFSYVNAITVVPGAIGAFRRKVIEEVGGFTSDTLAEDCDLTMRILRAGYVVKNENNAIAMTEAPESIKMFLRQRFRWSFGVMQSFWKNRDTLFNTRYKGLGMIAMPNILVFQVLIPLVAPLADLFMIFGLLTGNALEILKYYGVFMLVDASVAIVAFLFEKENMWRLLWLIPQRLVYRWLMLFVLFRSIRRAIKGELQHWGVLKRTGNVKEEFGHA